MSDFIEYKDKMAFHPGYYVKEIIEDGGLTQEEFAYRLGTTPKNLSILLRGEQRLSIDIAEKLSRMLGTTTTFWLNLQQSWDEVIAQIKYDEELEQEKRVFIYIDYKYFRDNFGLPDIPRKTNEQIKRVREFLRISSLMVLKEEKLSSVSFRSYRESLSESNTVNTNAMLQIAFNEAAGMKAPAYNRKSFERAIEYALTLTDCVPGYIDNMKEKFREAGVILVVLPNLSNSGVNGAVKKVDGKVMLMVNNRRLYADTFWFTLFHEIGHILNSDYGVSYDLDKKSDKEAAADRYAAEKLIPQAEYDTFIASSDSFTEETIRAFATSINRDPGIVLGRLKKDGLVPYTETMLDKKLRYRYEMLLTEDNTKESE